jgi:hypothetical protein
MAVWTASTKNMVSKTTKKKHNLLESFPAFGRALFLFSWGFVGIHLSGSDVRRRWEVGIGGQLRRGLCSPEKRYISAEPAVVRAWILRVVAGFAMIALRRNERGIGDGIRT